MRFFVMRVSCAAVIGESLTFAGEFFGGEGIPDDRWGVCGERRSVCFRRRSVHFRKRSASVEIGQACNSLTDLKESGAASLQHRTAPYLL
jgi:hypothetical protein